MKFLSGRVIVACCALGLVSAVLIFASLGVKRFAFTQEVATTQQATPKLFAMGYQAGEELAGFSGRPMVLVFGDSRVAGWTDFLIACESKANMAKFLQESFIGVYVDVATDKKGVQEIGVSKAGYMMVKDLHGPVWGILEPGSTSQDLIGLLNWAVSRIKVERSPIYTQLLQGPDILNDLVNRGEAAEAVKGVKLLRYFEQFDSTALKAVEARAIELGLSQ